MRSLAPLGMTVVDLARPIAASAVATTRDNADRATTIEAKTVKAFAVANAFPIQVA